MTEHTCDAPLPADLASGLAGDAAEPCLMEPGHDEFTDHTNAYVSWPTTRLIPRADLILSLMDSLSADDVELIRPFLRMAELAMPDAPDAELLTDALASLDALFALVEGEAGR
ncbi:hypothetical protein [Streptomyces sp. A30]|uniref:hypothetical protein n=1 Tax=Streptomyces sp. A30 TaxID=2789273 RepID=UPI00398080DC